MANTNNPGIDYGMGQTNRDPENGIRFGVISMHDVTQAWCDSVESDYGDPHCPECGLEAVSPEEAPDDDHEEGFRPYRNKSCCGDYYCLSCKIYFDGEDAFGDEIVADVLDDGEYEATRSGDDTDIFICKSPYYTHAQFCSPCAPGAGHLGNPCKDGPKTYCFGHDWFENGKAPYPVYSVETGKRVPAPRKKK